MPVPTIEKTIEHRIQKHIIGVLIHQKYARFRDLRPPKTDTNLFSYHLKALMKDGFIDKQSDGYTLSAAGLGYVDRVSLKKMNVRSQPKIITMLVVRDDRGRVLLQCRTKQPYIDTWTLPYGKTHISDASLAESAERETLEKLGSKPVLTEHIGDAYIRVSSTGQPLSTTLAHVFSIAFTELPATRDDLMWYKPGTDPDSSIAFAPAVTALIGEVAESSSRFFVEFNEVWG